MPRKRATTLGPVGGIAGGIRRESVPWPSNRPERTIRAIWVRSTRARPSSCPASPTRKVEDRRSAPSVAARRSLIEDNSASLTLSERISIRLATPCPGDRRNRAQIEVSGILDHLLTQIGRSKIDKPARVHRDRTRTLVKVDADAERICFRLDRKLVRRNLDPAGIGNAQHPAVADGTEAGDPDAVGKSPALRSPRRHCCPPR